MLKFGRYMFTILVWKRRPALTLSLLSRHPTQGQRREHLCDGAAPRCHQHHGKRTEAQHLLPELQWPRRRQQAAGAGRPGDGHRWQPLRWGPQLCAQGLSIYEHNWHPRVKVKTQHSKSGVERKRVRKERIIDKKMDWDLVGFFLSCRKKYW